jgi:hypothetical protein
MPVIPNLVLTNQLPINTYTASLVVSSSNFEGFPSHVVADGLGNQINIVELTASYAFSASVQQTYELSSSWASESFWATTASFTSRSFSSTSASWASQSFVSVTASFASSSGWSVSSSFASASFVASSASFASQSISGSWSATSSQFSPSQGAVTDAGPLTGSVSASGFGFTTDVEFNTFVTSVSASMIEFNSLLAKLRTAGVIS